VQEYTNLWGDPARACFKDIVANTSRFLEKLLSQHFGQFTRLEEYVKSLAFEDRNRRRDIADKMLQMILRLETNPVFTQNFRDLESEEKRWLSIYRNAREPQACAISSIPAMHHYPSPTVTRNSPRNVQTRSVDSDDIDHHFPSVTFSQDLRGNVQTWSVEDELKVMATVQAYFHVAHKRFIDYVPLAIENELNQAFAFGIEEVLFKSIFEDSEHGRLSLQDILTEDPALASKRKELGEKKTRLSQIEEKLDTFMLKSQLTSPNDHEWFMEVA